MKLRKVPNLQWSPHFYLMEFQKELYTQETVINQKFNYDIIIISNRPQLSIQPRNKSRLECLT